MCTSIACIIQLHHSVLAHFFLIVLRREGSTVGCSSMTRRCFPQHTTQASVCELPQNCHVIPVGNGPYLSLLPPVPSCTTPKSPPPFQPSKATPPTPFLHPPNGSSLEAHFTTRRWCWWWYSFNDPVVL